MEKNKQKKKDDSNSSSSSSSEKDNFQGSKLNKNHKDLWRVKLYKLEGDGNWKDVATGYASIQMHSKNPALRMTKEVSNELILNLKIKNHTFTRQRETIITWKSEGSTTKDNDNALSFQETKSVSELCELINILYGYDKIVEIDALEVLNELDSNNLASIVKCLTSEQTPNSSHKIVEKIISTDFFEKLYCILKEEERRIVCGGRKERDDHDCHGYGESYETGYGDKDEREVTQSTGVTGITGMTSGSGLSDINEMIVETVETGMIEKVNKSIVKDHNNSDNNTNNQMNFLIESEVALDSFISPSDYIDSQNKLDEKFAFLSDNITFPSHLDNNSMNKVNSPSHKRIIEKKIEEVKDKEKKKDYEDFKEKEFESKDDVGVVETVDYQEHLSSVTGISNNLDNKRHKDPEIDNDENNELLNFRLIFLIYKNLLSLGNQQLIETMLNDNNYLGTFGALEYHIESRQLTYHREFFQKKAKFHNFLGIKDSKILSKIKLIYRLTYLRDVAIARFIEENTLRAINILIQLHFNDIFSFISVNKGLLSRVVRYLRRTVNYAKQLKRKRVVFGRRKFEREYDKGTEISKDIDKYIDNKNRIKIFIKESELNSDENINKSNNIDITSNESSSVGDLEIPGKFKKEKLNNKSSEREIKNSNNYRKNKQKQSAYSKLNPSVKEKQIISAPIRFIKELLFVLKDNFNRKNTLDLLLNEYNFADILCDCLQSFPINSEYRNYVLSVLSDNNNINPTILTNQNSDFISQLRSELYYFSIEAFNHFLNGSHVTFKNKIVNNFAKHEGPIQSTKTDTTTTSTATLKKPSIIQILLNIIYYDENFGLKYEVGELIKCLLDENNLNLNLNLNLQSSIQHKLPKFDFFQFFFECYSKQLLGFLNCKFDQYNQLISDSKQIIIDFFSFSLVQNSKRTMDIFVEQKIIFRLVELTHLDDKRLDLFLVKFAKTAIFNGDEALFNVLTEKLEVFKILLKVLRKSILAIKPSIFTKPINNNKHKELGLNILGSSVLDCFECIKNSNLSSHYAEYLIQNHKEDLISMLPHTETAITILESIDTKKKKDNNYDINDQYILNKDSEDYITNKFFHYDLELKEKDSDEEVSDNDSQGDSTAKKFSSNSHINIIHPINSINTLFGMNSGSRFLSAKRKKHNININNITSSDFNFSLRSYSKGCKIINSYDDENEEEKEEEEDLFYNDYKQKDINVDDDDKDENEMLFMIIKEKKYMEEMKALKAKEGYNDIKNDLDKLN